MRVVVWEYINKLYLDNRLDDDESNHLWRGITRSGNHGYDGMKIIISVSINYITYIYVLIMVLSP